MAPRVAWIAWFLVAAPVAATTAPGPDSDAGPEARRELPHDTEAGKLDVYHGPVASRLGAPMDTVLAPWDGVRDELRERLGLDYLVSYSPIVQVGSWHDEDFTAHQEVDFIGQWTLVENDRLGVGGLRWWWLYIQTLSGANVTQFSRAAGSSWATNGGGTPGSGSESIEALGLLWYEHLLFDERLRVVVGKLDARQLFSRLNHVGDDRQDFFAEPLSNRPVQPAFARAGVGVFASWSSEHAWVSAMWKDAAADNRDVDFGSIGEGRYDYAAEVGFSPEVPRLGSGRYRFTAFYAAETDSAPWGWGFALSFDQDVSEQVGLFVRFSRSERQHRALQTILIAGVTIQGVAQWPQDTIGVGLVWGDPSDVDPANTRDQYGLEVFWNMRITRRLELSPDLQLLLDPSRGGSDFRAVAGLRLRIVL